MHDRTKKRQIFCRAMSQQCLVNEKIFLQIYELAVY